MNVIVVVLGWMSVTQLTTAKTTKTTSRAEFKQELYIKS